MLWCCRRRKCCEEVGVSALIEKIGDESDPKTARAVFGQLLKVSNDACRAGQGAYAVDPQLQLHPEAKRVLLACGFVGASGGGLSLPAGADRQALEEAHGLVSCMVASLEEGLGETATDDLIEDPSALAGALVPGPARGGSSGSAAMAVVPTPAAAPAATASKAAPAPVGPVAPAAGERPVRPAPEPPPLPAGPPPPSAQGSPAASVAGGGEGGAGGASSPAAEPEPAAREAGREPEPPAIPGAASPGGGGSGAAGRSDREVAEALAREQEPKVVAFERFRAEDVVVDPGVVEEINKYCRETGERYVDSQFPPLPRSLYLAEWEAESWECGACHARTKLPPVPPLPRSREEAQQQEEDFKANAKCSGCGAGAPYVVQVRHFTRPTQWLRPGERCEGCELFYGTLQEGRDLVCQMCTHFLRDSMSHMTVGSPWKLIREAARPEDVCQGGLGNCWFAGALSVVAQLPRLIERLFITKEYNPNGVYHMQLCHAGTWRGIVLDDLFPTSQIFEGYTDGRMVYYSRGGTLCYLQGARRQLWVPLVEKAAAKLFGSYGSLKGGTFGEALALFTGCPTQRIRMYVPKAVRKARAERREARQARRTQMLLQGMEVPGHESDDSDENDDLTWSKLLSCKDAGYLMGMGCTEEGCEKSKQHIVEEMGLQAPHAYGILDVREANANGRIVRLVKIRNPWGERSPRTWKGAWGKDSDKWTPELQQELGVVNSSGVPMDDPMSIFWMAFEDVKEYFAQVEICRVHDGWHEARQRAWLPSGLGPGEAFELTVFQRTPVDIAMWQERHIAREGALGARSTNVDVGLAVLRARGADSSGRPLFELVEYVERACTDDVSAELVLEGGYVYRLVPLCFCQMPETSPRCAVVAVHSVHPVELRKATSSWDEVACATIEGAKKLGNRWNDRTHPGVTYWLLHEAGGCVFAVENRSDRAAAVQADATESVGCASSRGDFGIVALVPAKSRAVVLALAFSPGAAYTRAAIAPQPVPLELAPPLEEVARDLSVHGPKPLPPDAWRESGPPPPSQAILRRRLEASAAASPPSAPEQPSAPSAPPSLPQPRAAAPAAPLSGAAPRAAAEAEEDEELAAALRLSLGLGAEATRAPPPQPAPPSAAPPVAPPPLPPDGPGRPARSDVEARAKELFQTFRAQGMAPHEAAARAGEIARGGTAASVA